MSATVPAAALARARRARTRALTEIRRRRSVVLGYHGVAESREQDDLHLLQIAPARFCGQIEMLADAGFEFVTLGELARRAGGRTPPPGLAAITFDDGMANNHETALPVLSARGIPATVYVTAGFIGARSPWIGPGDGGVMMTGSQLRELVAAGWELGGHTLTHPDLSALDYDACVAEIAGGIAELERTTGAEVQTFAYPHGRYGPAALAAVRDCGLRAAVTTGSGVWDRFEITRAMVGPRDPFGIVLLKLIDRYEPLFGRSPVGWMRGARRARAAARRRREQSGVAQL